jgi:hypothetical protein
MSRACPSAVTPLPCPRLARDHRPSLDRRALGSFAPLLLVMVARRKGARLVTLAARSRSDACCSSSTRQLGMTAWCDGLLASARSRSSPVGRSLLSLLLSAPYFRAPLPTLRPFQSPRGSCLREVCCLSRLLSFAQFARANLPISSLAYCGPCRSPLHVAFVVSRGVARRVAASCARVRTALRPRFI